MKATEYKPYAKLIRLICLMIFGYMDSNGTFILEGMSDCYQCLQINNCLKLF